MASFDKKGTNELVPTQTLTPARLQLPVKKPASGADASSDGPDGLAGSGSISTKAVTSFFATTAGGTLSVTGDSLDNTVTVSRDAAGKLLVNGGAVAINGGTPTVANTSLIQVFGLGGNDVITLTETNGALPKANLFGGAGNDTVTGGAGNDLLFGESGNDTLLGKGGFDFLFGGADNDVLTGGDADDQMFGEGGNDRMIWNPGDDTDLHEGGAGIDTSEVNGGGGAEIFTLTANGTRVRFDRLDPAPFSIDIGTTEHLVLNMNGGDDSFGATGNLAALISVTVDGGAGNDTINGSNGIDLLLGGDGNDRLDGQQGNDTAFLGAGDDTFVWDPGDGSDVVEGQAGADTLLFNGSAGNETFAASANGGRVRFTRDLGNIVMDLDDTEIIDLKALGGTDSITINDLSGTDVTQVKVDLAGTLGGATGDAQADTVVVQGRNANDMITVVGAGTSFAVNGLPAQVSVSNAEGANDKLVVNGLGGDDTIAAGTLPAGIVKLTLDGGAGHDTMTGSDGDDMLLGGDGNDLIVGDRGNDVAVLGAGNDRFAWNPGDGNDTVEGQAGLDTFLFYGANVAENIDIAANGGRVRFFRDVAAATADLDDVERIDVHAVGGADNIVVGDTSGTDLVLVNVKLAGTLGGNVADGQADKVTILGTNGDDVVKVDDPGAEIVVSGLHAQTRIQNAEAAKDRLVVAGNGGKDVLDASAVAAGKIAIEFQGGLGDDVIIGSEGDDLAFGGAGSDVALLGGGNDVFIWSPGDDNDTVEGQAGSDTLDFKGAVVAEQITISANGGRALFTRDIANVVMDTDDVETLSFDALGGLDTVTINDMSGTDVTKVAVNLAGTLGGAAGDGVADTVVVNATNGDDVIQVVSDGAGHVRVLGLAAEVDIFNFDLNTDKLVINGFSGDDAIDASGLAAGLLLFADGGNGQDVIIGGDGNDNLSGGEGDDVVLGGPGLDVIDGGIGDNVIIQGLTAQQSAFLL